MPRRNSNADRDRYRRPRAAETALRPAPVAEPIGDTEELARDLVRRGLAAPSVLDGFSRHPLRGRATPAHH